jgi:hypothetical protein
LSNCFQRCAIFVGRVFVLPLLLAQTCSGQISDSQGTGASRAENLQLTAQAAHVDKPPRLDGTLNDPLWQSVNPIGDFHQREPHEGEAPTEKTEVRILYSRNAVYFGIRCWDSEPERIVGTELREMSVRNWTTTSKF